MISRILGYLHFALTQVEPGGLPGSSNGNGQATNTNTSEIATILQVIFGIIGALALLFITLSGVRYITAAGDPQRMQQAKEGIIYALVGIAIAVSAEALVVFVLRNIS